MNRRLTCPKHFESCWTAVDGVWGIESVPDDGDEEGAAVKTLALMRRELGE